MKMQGSSFKHSYTFQASASRALNQMWAPLCAGRCADALITLPKKHMLGNKPEPSGHERQSWSLSGPALFW